MRYLIALVLISSSAFAAPKREGAVESAYALFPRFMRALTQDTEFCKSLANEEYGFLKQMAGLVTRRTIPLRFNPNAADFDLVEGQPRRWMRTPIMETEEPLWDWSQDYIEVNPQILNGAKEEVTIPFLLKILFHEWTHKIRYDNQAFADQMAQRIETQALKYFRTYDLDDGMRLQVFSMPLRALNEIVDMVPFDRPQPTNLLILDRSGVLEDITEPLLKSTEKTSTVTRSIFTGVSGAMYAIQRTFATVLTEMTKAVAEGMNSFMDQSGLGQAFNYKPIQPEIPEGLDVRMQELRVLDIQEVEALPQAEDVFVHFKSLWSFSRTNREMKINADGFPMQENFPVPMSAVVRIPRSPLVPVLAADFQVNARLSVDMDSQARVATVMRGSDGRIAKLVVAVTSESRPKKVSLSALYGQGSRLIGATSIEAGKSGQWNVTFEPQWAFLPKGASFIAEAVQIETHKLTYLNRLVELSPESAEGSGSAYAPNALVADSLVITGLKDGVTHDMTNFQFAEPVLLASNIKAPQASLDPDKIPIRFVLERDEKVREIRLMIRRSTYLVDIQDKDKPPMTDPEIMAQLGAMMWDGQLIKMGRGGHIVAMKDYAETLSVAPEAIIRQETTRGTEVRATIKAPFLAAAEIESKTQAHYPAMITPVAVEIVLDSGQIITHAYGAALKEEHCETLIDPTGLTQHLQKAMEEAKAKGEFKVNWGSPKTDEPNQ